MSRFLKYSLMPGEKIVRLGRFHWLYTVISFALFAICMAVGSGLSILISGFSTANFGGMPVPASMNTSGYSMWAVYAGAGVGAFIFISRLLVKATTEIVLTDKRFLFKRGVLSVRTEKMAICELNYCEIRQSLLGSIFNYGSVFVYTMTLDDDNILLPPIAEPHQFTSTIEHIKKGEAKAASADIVAQFQRQDPVSTMQNIKPPSDTDAS